MRVDGQPSQQGSAALRGDQLDSVEKGAGSHEFAPARVRSDALDVWVAIFVWLASGSPILTSSSSYDIVLVVGTFAIAGLGISRGFPHLGRLPIFLVAATAYVLWAGARHLVLGDDEQWYSLAGHLLKLSIPALFLATAKRPLEALVKAMGYIAITAIAIFAARQTVLYLTSIDIADAFDGLYPFTGALPDRSILIFNFDIPSEIYRNSGPFREPGLFAAYLVLALLFATSRTCQLSKKEQMAWGGILLVALLTTQSTMGLATAPLLLATWYIGQGRASPVALAAIVVVAIAIATAVWLYGGQTDKLAAQYQSVSAQSGGWYTSRLGNAIVDWQAIIAKPWAGYGFSETDRPILWVGDLNAGFGNGLTGTIVKFGWPLSITIFFLFLGGWYAVMRAPITCLLATLAFAMLLVGQQLLTLPVAYILLGRNMYGERRRVARPQQSARFGASAMNLEDWNRRRAQSRYR